VGKIKNISKKKRKMQQESKTLPLPNGQKSSMIKEHHLPKRRGLS
jgi:hypothetical protein